ncbi:MAG: hypothetical protein BIFFINMI_01668 [Phycisphaerae bacterium]|nr:hypothetical protein [Phycisphaerae bacterium]
MNQKTTIILLVLVLAAAGFVLCYQQGWLGLGDKVEAPSRVGQKLIASPPSSLDVERIELIRPDQPRLVLAQSDARWKIAEPIQADARGSKVDTLIDLLRDMDIAAVYPIGDKQTPEPSLTGLDKPLAELVVKAEVSTSLPWALTPAAGLMGRGGSDGHAPTIKVPATFHVRFGKTVPASDSRFVALGSDDKNVYAVTGLAMDGLRLAAADLRSTDVWNLDRSRIEKVSIVRRAESSLVDAPRPLVLTRGAAAHWAIAEPVQWAADSTKVDALLDALSGLKAASWDDSGRTVDPQNASVTLTVVQSGKPENSAATTQPAVGPSETLTLCLGGPGADGTLAAVQGAGQVFTIPDAKVKDLALELKDVRETKLTALGKNDVEQVSAVSPGPGADARPVRTDLVRLKSDRWQMTEPIKSDADKDKVEEWLGKLLGVQADSFRDQPDAVALAAMNDPQLTVTLTGADKAALKIAFSKPVGATGSTCYVRVGDSPALAVVESSKIKDALIDPMTLADRTVWTLDEDRVMRFARPDRTVERMADDWQRWQLVGPVKMAAEDSAVRGLLDKLVTLTAAQRTLLTPAQVGLDKPLTRITVVERIPPEPATQPATTAPDAPPAQPEGKPTFVERTLELARQDGKIYAWQVGQPVVWELDPAILDDVNAEWARRTLTDSAPAADAQKVELASPAGKVELAKVGQEWKLAGDPNVKIDARKVEEIVENIARLQVQSYAAFGLPASADLGKYAGLDNPATRLRITYAGDKPKTLELIASDKGVDGNVYVLLRRTPADASESANVALIAPGELKDKIQQDWKFFQKSE